MADLLGRFHCKQFYLLILMTLFISSCSSDDDDDIEQPVPVANSAPTISSADTDSASLGTLFTYTLTASDTDGDALTFQASILPVWLTFDAPSGELSGTPPAGSSGDYDVTLAASDGMDSTPLFLTISIANSAPAITSSANNNGVVGSAYSYTLTANDADADTLVYSSITLPSWGTFDATSGALTGTPTAAGDSEVELSVSDGDVSVNQKFTLVVTNEPAVVIGFDETVVFSDFGGAVADVIANPDKTGINTSDQVGRMQKFAGEEFGGSTISLNDPITLAAKLLFGQEISSQFSSGKSIAANNVFTLKVWSQRQVALTFKLEGDVDANDVERVVTHDGTGWEVLNFDFTGVTGTGYSAVTLIFDNGVVGDAADDADNWTFYFDDMVIPVATNDDDTDGGNTVGPEILVNSGFEAGFASWKDNVGTIEVDGSNSFFFADVQAAGDPWDVNQSQVITLMPDTDYILSFKAKASVARTIIAGLGQNFPDFIAVTETVALTTEWQTYTYTLTTTGFGGENNRVLFDMGSEIGAVSLDDVSVTLASVDNGGSTVGPEILVNSGFEAGFASWKDNVGTIEVDGSNSFFFADVQAAGDPWDVNQSQVITLMPDTDYILSFKAKASVARTIIAGLGQNFPDFIAVTETVALTTEWQTYTYTLTTTGFGGENNRVLFDMGSEIGAVSLDDVSVTLASVDNGGDTGGGDADGSDLTTNGNFETGDFSNWTVTENGGSITADNTQDSGSEWVAKLVTGNGNPTLTVAGLAAGTVMTNDPIDISFDMCGTLYGVSGQFRPSLLSERGGDSGATLEILQTFNPPDMPSVWTRYNYSVAAGADVTGGVSVQFDAVCGAVAGCGGDIYIDNVSVTIGGGVAPGAASGASCVVAVANSAPVITSTAKTTANVGITYSYTLTATDANAGDTISYSSDSGLPAWANFNDLTGVLSGTPDAVGTHDLELSATDGIDAVSQMFTITVIEPAPFAVELVIFENAEVANWALWVDTGGSTAVIADDVEHDQVAQFTQSVASVAGFNARDNGDMAFDASGLTNPMLTFELKLVQEPTAGPQDWRLKIEGAGASEVSLTTSVEGHAAPVVGTWQTYSFSLEAVAAAQGNLDISSMNLFMLFPGYATAPGVEFLVDNVKITSGTPPPVVNVDLVVFENAEVADWALWVDTGGSTAVITDDAEHDQVAQFTQSVASVAGFNARDNGDMAFDASALTNPMLRFELKLVQEPTAGPQDWRLKIEGAGASEVSLTTSIEGHSAPIVGTWQTYTFSLAAVAAAQGNLDISSMNLFMLFPGYATAPGVEFLVDNFKIISEEAVAVAVAPGSSMSGGDLVVDVTAGINFEGNEAEQASWDVFENQSNPALEFVANPVMVGNTSSQVAKITLDTAPAGNGKFAGAVTRTVTTFKLSTDTVIAKIWVWKDKISPVGIKFERKRGDGYGSHGELTVSNTKVNEWEQLTIDFTSQLGLPENDEISGIAIFPDMVDGRTGTVVYFDEITFTPN